MNPEPLPWEDSRWFQSASAWMLEKLAECDLQASGPVEQPHVRPWSTVLRVNTNGGWVYFKATAPCFAHETALTLYLSTRFPAVIPTILAANLEQRWLLMRDAGQPLRADIRESGSIQPWLPVLPHFVALQKEMSASRDILLKMGVFDRGLKTLPALFAALLEDAPALLLDLPDGLTGAEYADLRALPPVFERMCAELASLGIPESLHHDDFHDANVFVRDGRAVFTDWGESAAAHPFFTLVVMLRGLENTLKLEPDAEPVLALREAYLSHWTDLAPLPDLRRAAQLAGQIGLVNRALTWRRLLNFLPPVMQTDYASAVPAYLQDFLASVRE